MKGKKMWVKAVESGEFKLWEDGPNFDTEMRQDVVALEGKNAYLTCRVFDRGNKTVSPLISFIQTFFMKSSNFNKESTLLVKVTHDLLKKILHQLSN